MFNNYNWNDWQFVEGQQLMHRPLDAEGGSEIDIQLYAERKVRLYVVNTSTGDKLPLFDADYISGKFKVYGFDRMEVRTSTSNSYAVKLFVSDNLSGEANDGEMQILVPLDTPDQRMAVEMQRRLIAELSASGMENEAIVDVLEGLNTNDDDLEFEDDDTLPSEAEMDEMIAEAHAAAQQPLLDDRDIEQDQPAVEPNDDPDDPSSSQQND